MRHLSLFTGIGGFELAASWVWGDEWNPVAFCEIDKFCQKVLRKHWPNVPIIEDVREVTIEKVMAYTTGFGFYPGDKGSDLVRKLSKNQEQSGCGWSSEVRRSGGGRGEGKCSIDLLTGGFPCQPFSSAGKRKGASDERFLWPEMLRVIQEISPHWIIAENVPGLLTLNGGVEFEHCCSALENEGYEVQPFVIPACAVNAPHRRDRVWIVAHSNRHGLERPGTWIGPDWIGQCDENFRGKWWNIEPNVGRVANGVPARVDRLRALGNAIVPQVAAEIMKAIKEGIK